VLNELAADVPIGSDGLIALDYFQGNRAPHSDPLVRGAIWGLSLSHGPGHVFRAIMEGVCYGTQDVLRNLADHGFQPTEVIVAGGPTKSPLWTQMHADVTNQPLSITRGGDVSPVLGSAMLASVAAGIHGDLEEAAEHMVHVERTVEPDAEAHEAYQFYFDRYVETYEGLREPMHKVVQHVSAG
jgi:sugar (pentulose or hexulose) kinase